MVPLLAATVWPWLGPLMLVIGGLAAVAGWLTGTVRKSVSEARRNDISDLSGRVERQDSMIIELRAENAAQAATINTLLATARGDTELKDLVRTLHAFVDQCNGQHQELLAALRGKL